MVILVYFVSVSILKYFMAPKSGIVYLMNILIAGYHLMCYCQNTNLTVLLLYCSLLPPCGTLMNYARFNEHFQLQDAEKFLR